MKHPSVEMDDADVRPVEHLFRQPMPPLVRGWLIGPRKKLGEVDEVDAGRRGATRPTYSVFCVLGSGPVKLREVTWRGQQM